MMLQKLQALLLVAALTLQNPVICQLVNAAEDGMDNAYIEVLADESDMEKTEIWQEEETEEDVFRDEEETEGWKDMGEQESEETETEEEIFWVEDLPEEDDFSEVDDFEEDDSEEEDDFEEDFEEDNLLEEEEPEDNVEEETEEESMGFDIFSPGGLELSGVNISAADAWKEVSGFSSEYIPMCFYPGISYLEVFNHSDNVICSGSISNRIYLYPISEGQEGIFGGIYHNVLYRDGQWYDLCMTVDAYSSSVASQEGDQITGFPYIGFCETGIGWTVQEMFGELILRCDICDAGTGTPVSLKTRLQWAGIDGGHRYGIRTIDGSIAGKYYYPGSVLHVQENQMVCGVSGLDVVIGPECSASINQPEYAVCYELDDCSSYYLAFGYRDHLGEYGYTLKKCVLEEVFGKLADADYDMEEPGNTSLIQMGTPWSEIEMPSPVKKISRDKEKWYSEIKLEKISDHFWYQIAQYVPYQDQAYFYSEIRMKDILPDGVSFIGNPCVVREEDGRDVSDWFVISENEQVLVASVKKEVLQGKEFYGGHYSLQYEAILKEEQAPLEVQGETIRYCATDKALIQYRYHSDEDFLLKESNEVTVLAEKEVKEPEAPKEGIDGDISLTEKKISQKEEEIVFLISQKIPEYVKGVVPETVELTDTLSTCFVLDEITAEVRKKESELFYPVSLQQIDTEKGRAFWNYSKEYAGGELQFRMHCRIKKDADLSDYQKEDDQGIITEITDCADVIFHWENEKKEASVKKTNEVLIRYVEKRITLIKEIEADDIVWEHGKPVFTFHIYDEERNGKRLDLYRVISFEKGETQEGILKQQIELIVPEGRYVVTELPVIRYQTGFASEIINGTVTVAGVSFDLMKNPMGSAVFYSEKMTDEFTSDNAYINQIIG